MLSIRSRKNALMLLPMAVVLFAPMLFAGCKSEEAKKQAEVAEKVQAASDNAQKMTDEQLQRKAQEIQQKKGADPKNMTPDERAIIGQALVKGLM